MSSIASADRYAHWVSVVCRNTYLNFLRSRPRTANEPIDDELSSFIDPIRALQTTQLRQTLCASIDRLPAFLSVVARLRFVDQKSYQEIGQATGKPVPVIRAYAHRAAIRLRADARLVEALR
jgi:RNA polymerase sigma factor (sigma-70 family)